MMAAPAAALFLPAGVLARELLVLLALLLERAHFFFRIFVRLRDTVLVPLAVIVGYLTLLTPVDCETLLTGTISVKRLAIRRIVRLIGLASSRPELLAALALIQ